MAVNFGYRKNRKVAAILMLVTALFGASFVGMQVFEWSKLIIDEGVPPMGQPDGGCAVWFNLFHGDWFSRAARIDRSHLPQHRGQESMERRFTKNTRNYEIIEIAGLYWHFVDLVWVFIFAFFYLW